MSAFNPDDMRCGECGTDYRHELDLLSHKQVWLPPRPIRPRGGKRCDHPLASAEVLVEGIWEGVTARNEP